MRSTFCGRLDHLPPCDIVYSRLKVILLWSYTQTTTQPQPHHGIVCKSNCLRMGLFSLHQPASHTHTHSRQTENTSVLNNSKKKTIFSNTWEVIFTFYNQFVCSRLLLQTTILFFLLLFTSIQHVWVVLIYFASTILVVFGELFQRSSAYSLTFARR